MESYIKKILNELEESQEELDEMSVTGNLDGGEGPPKKGNYEYLCTYPGHAEIMRGYFFVK
tara:strand:- start:1214 stop:1396 length:183 start_codon:yes stop_codon:yes gene_type:complete